MTHKSQVISETIFPANVLTGTKHSALSTNHMADSDKIKCNNQKQHFQRHLLTLTTSIFIVFIFL